MNVSQKVLIAGAGLMGSGIAQTLAAHGYMLILYDISDTQLKHAEQRIRWSAEKLHARQPESWPGVEELLSRITFAMDLTQGADAEIVIEAVAERLEIKGELFQKLHRLCNSKTLFYTNTSAIPISELAGLSGRPDRFCGLHFFSPVPLMRLVEVIRGEQTADFVVEAARQLARNCGKTPVEVQKDVAGFVVNRLFIAMLLEAIRMVESGVASVADVDTAMKLGCGHKMGPLETADMSGLDVFLHATEAIYLENGDERYRPPELLKEKVRLGHLGRKSGEGFYPYNN